MKLHRWEDVKRRRLSEKEMAQVKRQAMKESLRLSLRELREMSGKTQVEVAKVTKMTQGELSRAERREDHLLSTLKRYIEALGGELEVAAVFGDKRVRLRGV
ncbi:MAG: helix-turn-helix transcriptional regulator [Deltaproteobacteria bacterium]|nr:helix-turn-helix transcriptional regulator [Deltaproteobacteria bacterium]